MTRYASISDIPKPARDRNAEKLGAKPDSQPGFLGAMAQHQAARKAAAIDEGADRELSETLIQQQLVEKVRANLADYPEMYFVYAIPNGSATSEANRLRLLSEGLLPGVPDLVLDLPIWSQQVSGLYLECKTQTGTISKVQRQFAALRACNPGKQCVVFRSVNEGWSMLMVYIDRFRASGGRVMIPDDCRRGAG